MLEENIVFDVPERITNPADQSAATHARGVIVWLTGLSSAGKSTIGEGVAKVLKWPDGRVEILDGDVIRRHLCEDLGFSRLDREKNAQRIAFIAGILARNGIDVIVSMISPYRSTRECIRAGCPDFIEVYVNASLKTCEERDVKGLYKRARAKEILGFTGIDDPYEAPLRPDVECCTDIETIDESVAKVVRYIEAYRTQTQEK